MRYSTILRRKVYNIYTVLNALLTGSCLDFDPEALELREDDDQLEKEPRDSDDSDEESEDDNAGREHYVAVG